MKNKNKTELVSGDKIYLIFVILGIDCNFLVTKVMVYF